MNVGLCLVGVPGGLWGGVQPARTQAHPWPSGEDSEVDQLHCKQAWEGRTLAQARTHRRQAQAGTWVNLTATVQLQLKSEESGLRICSELNDLIPLGLRGIATRNPCVFVENVLGFLNNIYF